MRTCSEYVLDMSEGLHDMGGLRWQLVLCLLGAWLLVFVCLIKGIKSQGKVLTLPPSSSRLQHGWSFPSVKRYIVVGFFNV